MVVNRRNGTLFALSVTGVLVVTMLQLKTPPQPTPFDETVRATTATVQPTPRAPRVNAAAAKAYAEKRQADALCLIALGRATGDPSWLQRALAEHPEDPRVQLERWSAAKTPEERLAAARALQKAAPDNPLGAYLEAGQAFGNRDLGAVARLMVDAEAAPSYDTYSADILVETRDAFSAMGLDNAAAWMAAVGSCTDIWFKTTGDLRQLGDDMGELQHVFVEMGYWDEADFMFERTLALGEQMEGGASFNESILGLVLQAKLLGSFDPETVVDDAGTRAGERLAQVRQTQTETLASLADKRWQGAIQTLDADGWEQYLAIYRRDGELAATRWLNEKK